MAHKFISLPIELASVKLIASIDPELRHNYTLICYSIALDTIGFTRIRSPEDKEYICKSEEEFHTKVGHAKLMRLL